MMQLIKNEAGQHEERDFISAPLWWHNCGLSQTATGYGAKLVTPNKVFYAGKLRRIYCICYSNSGSLYVMRGKERVFI